MNALLSGSERFRDKLSDATRQMMEDLDSKKAIREKQRQQESWVEDFMGSASEMRTYAKKIAAQANRLKKRTGDTDDRGDDMTAQEDTERRQLIMTAADEARIALRTWAPEQSLAAYIGDESTRAQFELERLVKACEAISDYLSPPRKQTAEGSEDVSDESGRGYSSESERNTLREVIETTEDPKRLYDQMNHLYDAAIILGCS